MSYPRLNGLAPVFIRLMERGWVTHLDTNGAGIIHDWEFSFQGKSSEDVRANVLEGNFGIWQETGFTINLALIVGAYAGLGYGESVGSMIENECLNIPDSEALRSGGSQWDWQTDGEPPPDNPTYYLRYCKTFSRMGGHMRYLCMDNREFLLHLLHELERT